MSETYRIDIRTPDGQLLRQHETRTPDRAAAVAAYRGLLSRSFKAPGYAARLVVMGEGGKNRSVYFSHYDKPLGHGRIHPQAPLMAGLLDPSQVERVERWTPLEEGTGQLLALVRDALDRGDDGLVETQAEYVAGVLLSSVLADGFDEVKRRVSGQGEGYSVDDDKMLRISMRTLAGALKNAGFEVE